MELAVRRGRDGRGPDPHDPPRRATDGGADERADGGADDDVGTDVRAHVTADPSAEQHTNIGAANQSDRALRQYPRLRLRVFKRL